MYKSVLSLFGDALTIFGSNEVFPKSLYRLNSLSYARKTSYPAYFFSCVIYLSLNAFIKNFRRRLLHIVSKDIMARFSELSYFPSFLSV